MERGIVVISACLIGAFAAPASGADPLAGNALLFDGNSDYTLVPDSPSLDLSSAATIEFWISPQEPQLNSGRIIQKGDGIDGNSDRAYEMEITRNDHPYGRGLAGTFFQGTSTFTVTFSPTDWVAGEWIHVCSTFDMSTSELKLYLNGAPASVSTTNPGAIRNSSFPLLFGAIPGFDRYYKGLLDEVRIWNTVRSPSEIAANYNRLVANDTVGLVGHWDFDEPFGDQHIFDGSPFGNDGVLGDSLAVASNDPTRVVSTAPIVPEPSVGVMLLCVCFVVAQRRIFGGGETGNCMFTACVHLRRKHDTWGEVEGV